MEDGVKLDMDHIQGHNLGGSNFAENLVTACLACSRSKNNNPLPPKEQERLLEIVRIRNLEAEIAPTTVIKDSNQIREKRKKK